MLSGINQPQNDTCFVIPSSEAESSRGCRYGAPIRDNAQQQDCVSMAMGSTPPTTHWKATGCGWAGLVVQRGTRPTSIAEPGTSTRNPLPADATGGSRWQPPPQQTWVMGGMQWTLNVHVSHLRSPRPSALPPLGTHCRRRQWRLLSPTATASAPAQPQSL